MTFLIPTIYQFILLIICGDYLVQTFSRLESISKLVETLSQADLELMACAQNQANLANIKDAYSFLLSKFPHRRQELRKIKADLLTNLQRHEMPCTHPIFKNIHSSIHKQQSRKTAKGWPNWIFAMEESGS